MKLGRVGPAARTVFSARDHRFAANLMAHLVVPTIVTDAEHRVVIWNKACERLTGMPASRVLGTTDQWRAFYLERRPCLANLIVDGRDDEIAAYYSSWSKFGHSEFGVSVENWCDLRHAGRRAYLAIDAGPVFDEEGTLVAVVETVRDITAQKEAQEALALLAAQDSLTGLGNRRTFDAALARETVRCAQAGAPLSLLLTDIDHFKSYNDYYGHGGGDECLKRVAIAIAGSVCQAGDVVARYGGEEFAVVLPGTDLIGARLIAERICNAVEQLGIPHAASATNPVVTVSVGGATGLSLEPRTQLAVADAALYRAKRNGRNRCNVEATTNLRLRGARDAYDPQSTGRRRSVV